MSSVQTALHRESCRLQTSHHRGDGQDKGDIDTVNISKKIVVFAEVVNIA